MRENLKKYAAVVDELRTRRYLSGLTQRQLGEAIGHSRHTIRDLETLRHEPKADVLRKIAAYYSLPEDYFINLIGKEGKNAEDASSEAKEQIEDLAEQRQEVCRRFGRFGHCSAMETFKALAALKEEALERIFSAIEDALANPNNIKGCEPCSCCDK